MEVYKLLIPHLKACIESLPVRALEEILNVLGSLSRTNEGFEEVIAKLKY